MTRSTPSRPGAASEAALSAAFSRAVDLSALKRPAEPARSATASAPAKTSPHVFDVDEATFGPAVIDRSMDVLVIVDLWAEWCQPCKQLSPLLEKLVDEYQGAVVLAKVDVDANPRISQAFGVQSIPTVVAIAAGQPLTAFSGAQPEAQLRQWLSQLVTAVSAQLPGMQRAAQPQDGDDDAVDPVLLVAEEALDRGDFAAALAAYEKYSAERPGDSAAKLAVAQVRLQQEASLLPPDVIERAAATPDDASAQLAAATLLFAQGAAEESFELLVRRFGEYSGADRADDRQAVQKRLVELFELLGHTDPAVIRWRRRLAAALY
jgi:putative thioredoxin